MKPVVKFEPEAQPNVKLETPARPVLKLKAEPEAAINKTTLSKPVVDLEPRLGSVSSEDSGAAPVSRPKRATLPMSAPVAMPVTKLKLLPMLKPETDPNYDPFTPMESDSDQKHKALSEQTRITETQLSQKEINHYIGRIQAAVEKQWRIPVAIYNITDPLVEMTLQSGGQIQSLIILESSGNATLDASLIRAIQAAAAFDIPKEHFEYFRVNRIRFHPF
jgi:TonB family protein